MQPVVVLAVLFCSRLAGWGQTTAVAVAGVEQALLRLDYAVAEQRIAQLPSAAERSFYRHHLAFVRAVVTQDPRQYAAFEAVSASTERLYAALPEGPFRRMYVAELYFERALLKALQQRTFAAFWDVRRCYQQLKAQRRRYPHVVQADRLLGLFEVGVASLPEQYQWAANLLGYRGELAAGLAKLHAAAARSEHLRAEAGILLAFVEKHMAGDLSGSGKRLEDLYAGDSAAPVLRYLVASAHMERKQNARAQALLADLPATQLGHMPLLRYAQGRCALYAGRWDEAAGHFAAFLAAYRGKLLACDAQYKLGLAHALAGRQAPARDAMAKVAAQPASGFDEDNYAARQAKAYIQHPPTAADRQLLLARLRFDGGYLQAALAALDAAGKLPLDEEQHAEAAYRRGRVYHELAQSAAAAGAYRACIARQPERNLWMKVYSLYYLGVLAEQAGNHAAAGDWYRQAGTYRGYDYRLGLEQKLKAAAERLRQHGVQVD